MTESETLTVGRKSFTTNLAWRAAKELLRRKSYRVVGHVRYWNYEFMQIEKV